MKKAILFVLIIAASVAVSAQEAAKKYEPTEIQSLRLQVKQKDAILAQQSIASAQQAVTLAQQNFTKAIEEMNAEAETIKKANKWPETVQLNPQTLAFEAKPQVAAK